jgi:hypothetical protein
LRYDGVPLNLSKDGRLKLFYYGIFSAAETGNARSPASNAHLKVPFTFSSRELLIEASTPSKFVGGYGVLFSGVCIVSLAAYVYLAIRRKSTSEMTVFIWLSVAVCLILISCLLDPIPNYARYGSQLTLFPISVLIALLLIAGNRWKVERVLAVVLIILLTENIALDIAAAASLNIQGFTSINAQLTDLKHSNGTYLAHASLFYSNYARLQSHGVRIVISQKPIACSNAVILDASAGSTKLCRL